MTMASRYPAASPRRAIEEIAESWKAAGMPSKIAQGLLCAVPDCGWRSVVQVGTINGDWHLCMMHEKVARDLAEGKNPFK